MTAITPTYSGPLVTLYRGDCRDVLAGLPAGSVDAVVTEGRFIGVEQDEASHATATRRISRSRALEPRLALSDAEPSKPGPAPRIRLVASWGPS